MSETIIKSYGFKPVKLDSNKVRLKIGRLRGNAIGKITNSIIEEDKRLDNMEWAELCGQIKALDRVLELFADDTMEDMI